MSNEVDLYKKFGIQEPKPFSTKLQVHIGEEHNEIRLILKLHLQKLGFDIRTTGDGYLALNDLKHRSADIALQSDNLPNMNAYDILKELSEDPMAIRPAFITLTNPLSKAEFMFAVENGVDDLMVRPVVLADILPKLKSAYHKYINPKNPERLYEYAKSRIRKNDLDMAYQVYKSLSDSNSSAARPLVGMGRVFFMQNKPEEAIRCITKAIDCNEHYIHAFALRGEILSTVREFDRALLDLKKAVELSPLVIRRYEQCSEILLRQQKIDECIQILTIGINAGLQHHFLMEKLGHCYFMKKDYHNALKYTREALRLDPDNTSHLNALAICYRDAKDYDKAIATYNAALKKEPENHLLLFNKALTLILYNKKEDAVKLLQRVIKIDPNFVKAKDKLKEIESSLAGGNL